MTEDDDAAFFSTLAMNLSKALAQIATAVGLNPDDDVLEATIVRVQQLAARDAVVEKFCGERGRYITSINNCHPDNDHDYYRWQGHAEARRQLTERLAARGEGEKS